MNASSKEPTEKWERFHHRVTQLEKLRERNVFEHYFEASIVVSIIGLVLIALYIFAIRLFLIHLIGALFLSLGLAVAIIIQWLKSSNKIEQKERMKMIIERGQTFRCEYLDGEIETSDKSSNGFCRLYNQELKEYPFCVYCKSYTAKR